MLECYHNTGMQHNWNANSMTANENTVMLPEWLNAEMLDWLNAGRYYSTRMLECCNVCCNDAWMLTCWNSEYWHTMLTSWDDAWTAEMLNLDCRHDDMLWFRNNTIMLICWNADKSKSLACCSCNPRLEDCWHQGCIASILKHCNDELHAGVSDGWHANMHARTLKCDCTDTGLLECWNARILPCWHASIRERWNEAIVSW